MTAREGRHTGMSGSCLAQGISSLRQKCQYSTVFMKNLNTGFVFLGSLVPIPAAKEFNFHLPYRKLLCLCILEFCEWSHLELGTSLWVASSLPLYHQSPASTGGCVLSPPTEHGHPRLCAASPNYGPQCQTYPLNSHPEICMKSRTVQAGKF